MLKKVVCAHEKHYLFAEKYGLSSCNHVIYGSVKGSKLAEEVVFFPYDQLTQLGIEGMCDALWEKCINERPQALIFYAPWQGYWGPLVETLNRLRRENIKVIAFYSDMITAKVDAKRYELYTAYSECADCLLSIDSNETRPFSNHPLYIQGYAGWNPQDFAGIPAEKDIDVSFLGSRSQSYYSRRDYIAFLEQNLAQRGISFLVGGGQLPEEKVQTLTRADYINSLGRSRITLNFSRTLGDARQLKGRVFEALACRTFLLDEENPNTGRLFEEGTDYRAFNNKEELLNLILYYLDKEDEREAIAYSGWQKVQTTWNARNLWGYVFTKLGFYLPELQNDQFAHFCQLMDGIQSAQ